MKTIAWLLLGSIVVYLVACSGLSSSKARAFDSIKLGDGRKAVIDALGAPDVRELPAELFSRYASKPCGAPCKERLWFENRLTLGIEAWSVELDQDDRIIHKAHWFSP
jgi:hypothetical protein